MVATTAAHAEQTGGGSHAGAMSASVLAQLVTERAFGMFCDADTTPAV